MYIKVMLNLWAFHPRNKMNAQDDFLNNLESSVNSFESQIFNWFYFQRSPHFFGLLAMGVSYISAAWVQLLLKSLIIS